MSRKLIDADRLKKEIHENDIMGGLNYAWYIDHAELVDAVEVKHGIWINKYPLSTCSVCSATMILNDYGTYCPNCGAKMDGVVMNDE